MISTSSSSLETWLLKQPGPSLSSCRNQSGLHEIFIESLTTSNIIFEKDIHSNIRAFYYSLLCVIYEREGEESTRIERKFKSLLLSEETRLDQFDIPALKSKHKEFYNNISLKRLIIEMLGEISLKKEASRRNLEGSSKRIIKGIINQYPIMDLVMMLLIRAVINYHRHSNTPVSTKLSTSVIAEAFWELFTFGSYQIAPNTWAFEILKTTFDSKGVYEQIGNLEDITTRSSCFMATQPFRKQMCETIQEVEKQDSVSDFNLSLEELPIPNKHQRQSVASSIQSIHLQLKNIDFQESVSEISRRQSISEDSFIQKVNLFMENQVGNTSKGSKDYGLFENREPNTVRRRPSQPLRSKQNILNLL